MVPETIVREPWSKITGQRTLAVGRSTVPVSVASEQRAVGVAAAEWPINSPAVARQGKHELCAPLCRALSPERLFIQRRSCAGTLRDARRTWLRSPSKPAADSQPTHHGPAALITAPRLPPRPSRRLAPPRRRTRVAGFARTRGRTRLGAGVGRLSAMSQECRRRPKRGIACEMEAVKGRESHSRLPPQRLQRPAGAPHESETCSRHVGRSTLVGTRTDRRMGLTAACSGAAEMVQRAHCQRHTAEH